MKNSLNLLSAVREALEHIDMAILALRDAYTDGDGFLIEQCNIICEHTENKLRELEEEALSDWNKSVVVVSDVSLANQEHVDDIARKLLDKNSELYRRLAK